ncbi:hypothetical protein [Reyranella sp.]|uniref:hypothetical protein n=1 Tax=Reyranella sp. TaxID=1929291 RepID=UPI003BAD97D7
MAAFLLLDLCVICWLLYSWSQERAPRRFDWKGVLAVCMGFWSVLVVLNSDVFSPLTVTLGLILVFALFRIGVVGFLSPSPASVVGIAAVLIVAIGGGLWRAPARVRLAVVSLALCGTLVLVLWRITTSIGTRIDFLGPPLLGAAGVAVICAGLVGVIARRAPLAVHLAVFLSIFGGVFLVWAESRRSHLMQAAISAIAPDCSRQSSFLSSMHAAGAWPQFFVHAILKKGSSIQIWSYREMKFVELADRARANIAGC